MAQFFAAHRLVYHLSVGFSRHHAVPDTASFQLWRFVRAQPGRFPLSPAISAQGTACEGTGLGRARDSRRGRARISVLILHSTEFQRIPPDLCTFLLILSARVAPSLRIRASCSCRASSIAWAGAPSPIRRVSRQPARILLTAQRAWKSES